MTDAISSTFKVGRKYRCSLTLPLAGSGMGSIDAKWEPQPRRLTKAELRDYRRGRDALLAEAARYLGGPVLVVEV